MDEADGLLGHIFDRIHATAPSPFLLNKFEHPVLGGVAVVTYQIGNAYLGQIVGLPSLVKGFGALDPEAAQFGHTRLVHMLRQTFAEFAKVSGA